MSVRSSLDSKCKHGVPAKIKPSGFPHSLPCSGPHLHDAAGSLGCRSGGDRAVVLVAVITMSSGGGQGLQMQRCEERTRGKGKALAGLSIHWHYLLGPFPAPRKLAVLTALGREECEDLGS